MRKLFSQREGFKPVRGTLQLGSMENELRSRLWDLVTLNYWTHVHGISLDESNNYSMKSLVRRIWHRYFKKPIDTISWDWRQVQSQIRTYFFNCDWNEVYDFIEFVSAESPFTGINASFRSACNEVLEQELSGYRFVADQITPITAEEEIAEIEEAAMLTGKLSPVTQHIHQALELLSDREKPDYRNSIKESISAVEALCRIVADTPKATLGDALKKIETKVKMHPALNQAFGKLYGYTSDADGIRHSLLDESNLRFEDAKYMAVTCSSFVNYVVAKAIEAGISF
jgi:hypothetical protein